VPLVIRGSTLGSVYRLEDALSSHAIHCILLGSFPRFFFALPHRPPPIPRLPTHETFPSRYKSTFSQLCHRHHHLALRLPHLAAPANTAKTVANLSQSQIYRHVLHLMAFHPNSVAGGRVGTLCYLLVYLVGCNYSRGCSFQPCHPLHSPKQFSAVFFALPHHPPPYSEAPDARNLSFPL
jgi:hypothetical protein